jgi:hypothetical protein
VSTPELMQLLSGKSIILYFPPKETAGLAILAVNTPNLLPWPPARSMAIISFFIMLHLVEIEYVDTPNMPERHITENRFFLIMSISQAMT